MSYFPLLRFVSLFLFCCIPVFKIIKLTDQVNEDYKITRLFYSLAVVKTVE